MTMRQSVSSNTFAAIILAASGCAGEPAESRTPHNEPPAARQTELHKESEMAEILPQKLIISKPNESNRMVQIGTLDFEDSSEGSLKILVGGKEAYQLEEDWQEIAEQPELIWKKSVPAEVEGESVMRSVGQTVHPGDDDYIFAVLNTLERLYGYSVDFEQ